MSYPVIASPASLLPPQDTRREVSGQHVHLVTGERFAYQVSFEPLGTMVDWRAQVRGDDGVHQRLSGSIRLSRGQTHSVAPTLVSHMVEQAIDRMGQAVPQPT